MTLKKLTLPELLKNSCSKFSKNLSLNFVASGKKTYQDLYNEVVSIANLTSFRCKERRQGCHFKCEHAELGNHPIRHRKHWSHCRTDLTGILFYRTPEYIGTCGGKSDLRFPPTGKMFGRSKNTIP